MGSSFTWMRRKVLEVETFDTLTSVTKKTKSLEQYRRVSWRYRMAKLTKDIHSDIKNWVHFDIKNYVMEMVFDKNKSYRM